MAMEIEIHILKNILIDLNHVKIINVPYIYIYIYILTI